jgi:protein SCO1/2
MCKVFATLLSLLFVLAACGGPPYQFHGTAYDPVKPAPELVGVQAGDAPFNLRDLPEKVKLVFFGYTFCPDVCPLTLSNMRAAYDLLSTAQQRNVAAVFVSVDPERDTPDRLGEYVHAFHPAFYGVYVPAGVLEQVKQGFGVYAEKSEVDSSQSAAEYLVDHTAAVYVIDKDDNLRAVFSNDAPPADIAADVEHLLKQ